MTRLEPPAASPAELQARGLQALREGRFGEAEDCYRGLVAIERHPSLLNNLGLVLVAQRRHGEALPFFEEALRARPGDVNVRVALASALLFCDRPAQALARCDEALAIDPANADARHNRAVALGALNRNAEAIEAFRARLREDPRDADAEFNLGVNELLLRDYAQGWRHYEARWRGAGARAPLPHPGVPLWREGEPLAGRCVLALAEQGLGDTINFVRWLPRLAARCAAVSLQAQPALVPLLRRNFPGYDVQPLGAPPPQGVELRLPLLALPQALALGPAFDAFDAPYLRADEARTQAWSQRLGPARGARVGLAWQCSRTHRRYATRSIALEKLRPWLAATARAGREVVVLHNDVSAAEREALAAFAHVRVPGEALADFDDTAAVLALLDDVVSVDTSVLHLAGAMGRPATLLLQFAPDFRWGLARERCGLYPSLRLLRQPAPGDWEAVLRRLVEELA